MKLLIMLIMMGTLPLSSFANDPDRGDAVPTNGTRTMTEEEQQMYKLLQIDGVAAKKEECENRTDTEKAKESLGDCIWREVQDDDALKTAIEEKMKEDDQDKDEKTLANYESRQLNDLSITQGVQDPVMDKLEEYMAKKMNDAMYGKGEVKNVVDHRNYYDLFKTSVGKSLIGKMSEFCLDSNFLTATNGIVIDSAYDNRKKQRKENIRLLGDQSSSLTLFKSQGGNNSVEKKWMNCVGSIQTICDKLILKKVDDTAIAQDTLSDDNKDSYTRERACLVVEYSKKARQNLKITNRILDRFQELGTSEGRGFQGVNVKKFEAKGENSANSLTTFTSKEIADDSGVQEAADAEFAKLKKCYDLKLDEDGKVEEGQLQDPEACKDFIGSNRKELEEKLAELKLRIENQKRKQSKDMLTDEEIIKYLKEKGHSEEKAQELLALNKGEYIKEIITKRYDREKEQALKAIRKEIMATTTSGEEFDATKKEDVDNIKSIGQRLGTKAEDLKQLIHFNNIALSFLSITQEGAAESTRNITSLKKELESSAFEEDSSVQDMTALKQKVDESQALNEASDNDNGTSAEFKVEDINKVFKHEPADSNP